MIYSRILVLMLVFCVLVLNILHNFTAVLENTLVKLNKYKYETLENEIAFFIEQICRILHYF